jgi:eukaryotic-like serine/threonine-protein kinase
MLAPAIDSAAETALDEAMGMCLDTVGGRAELVRWLGTYPELASELADHLAAYEQVEHWMAPLRPIPKSHDQVTVSYPGRTETVGEAAILDFGDFELLGELGRGGMGVVFKARQKSLDRIVALKTTLAGDFPSPRDVARLRFEAESAARLDHPHIVPIYGAGEHQGMPFFSMKYVSGGTLADGLKLQRQDFCKAAALLAKVARAVQYAHQHGVLHRDLKPGNILLENGEPMIADFGLAKATGGPSGLSASGAIVGTPAYMAPEQARGDRGLTTAADVYSLGAITYELLTDRPPFQGQSAFETISKVIDQCPTEPHTLNPEVPADLEAVCLKCLEKKAENRYASAADLANDLERFSRGESVSVRPGGLVSQIIRAVRSRRELGPAGDRWVAVVARSSAAVAAAHVAIFGLVAGGSLMLWVWLVLIAYFAFVGMERFRQSQRARTFIPWERHTIALWGGQLIATIALAAVILPFDPAAPADRVLVWYPPLIVLYALTLFVQGSISWGGYFVGSFVYMLLAFAMRYTGPAAPLVFAAVHVPAMMFLNSARSRPTRQ